MDIKWKCDYTNSLESIYTLDMYLNIPDDFFKLNYNFFNEMEEYKIFLSNI